MNKQDKRCPQDAAIFVPAESLYGKRLVGSEFIKNKAFYDGDTFYVPNDALNDMDALDSKITEKILSHYYRLTRQ